MTRWKLLGVLLMVGLSLGCRSVRVESPVIRARKETLTARRERLEASLETHRVAQSDLELRGGRNPGQREHWARNVRDMQEELAAIDAEMKLLRQGIETEEAREQWEQERGLFR